MNESQDTKPLENQPTNNQPFITKGIIMGLLVAIGVCVVFYESIYSSSAAVSKSVTDSDSKSGSSVQGDAQPNEISLPDLQPVDSNPLLKGVNGKADDTGISFGAKSQQGQAQQGQTQQKQAQQMQKQAPKPTPTPTPEPSKTADGLILGNVLQTKTEDIVTFKAYQIDGPELSFALKSELEGKESDNSVQSRTLPYEPKNELFEFVDGKIYVVNGYKGIIEVYNTVNAGFEYKDAIRLPDMDSIGIAYGVVCSDAPECLVKSAKEKGKECTIKINIKSKKSYDPSCS